MGLVRLRSGWDGLNSVSRLILGFQPTKKTQNIHLKKLFNFGFLQIFSNSNRLRDFFEKYIQIFKIQYLGYF